jgi:hypothetical protein
MKKVIQEINYNKLRKWLLIGGLISLCVGVGVVKMIMRVFI